MRGYFALYRSKYDEILCSRLERSCKLVGKAASRLTSYSLAEYSKQPTGPCSRGTLQALDSAGHNVLAHVPLWRTPGR